MATTAWQHSSLENTNLHMLENEILCDVTFLVGENKKAMKCHKFMLVSRSPVFYTMFCGALAETSETVSVPDIEPKIWKLFLRFIYFGDCETDGESSMYLLYLAKKYDLPTLVELCNKCLENCIDVDNVCTILNQTVVFEEEELKQKCLEFMTKETENVLQSPDFLTLSVDVMKVFLSLDRMDITGEEQLYTALKRWATASCENKGLEITSPENLRNELVDVLPLIRFPTLSIEIFTRLVIKDNILDNQEKLNVVQDIVCKESNSIFSNVKRLPRSLRIVLEIERLKKTDGKLGHNGKQQDGISFTVSKPAVLMDVALYLPYSTNDVSGTLEIFECDTQLVSDTVYLMPKGNTKFDFVSLSKTVNLVPDKIYSVRQRLNGGETFNGNGDKGKQVFDDMEVEFLDLQVGTSEASTNKCKGQIHGLRICREKDVGMNASETF